MARRAAKVDKNQPDIVQAFRRLGCSVAITSGVHSGFPDLVIGFNGVTVLVEVKDGSLPPSQRKLTPEQVEFHNVFTGAITVVESIESAVSLVAKVRQASQMIQDLKW